MSESLPSIGILFDVFLYLHPTAPSEGLRVDSDDLTGSLDRTIHNCSIHVGVISDIDQDGFVVELNHTEIERVVDRCPSSKCIVAYEGQPLDATGCVRLQTRSGPLRLREGRAEDTAGDGGN